jgi:hypothetical protein
MPLADMDKTTMTETTEHEMTYAANTTTTTALSGASSKSGGKMVKKKGAKPKLTAKEKKERNVRLVTFKRVRSINEIFWGARIDISGEDHFVSTTRVPGQRSCQSFLVLTQLFFFTSPFTEPTP